MDSINNKIPIIIKKLDKILYKSLLLINFEKIPQIIIPSIQ
jgi:hypothetical protein